MAEVAFEGINQGCLCGDLEWGLDGWSSLNEFIMIITLPDSTAKASLSTEQCSQLAAALIEHVKEVNDASEKNSN